MSVCLRCGATLEAARACPRCASVAERATAPLDGSVAPDDAASLRDFEPGEVVAGHVVIRTIGRGSSAVVLLVQRDGAPPAALKLLATAMWHPDQLRRLLREGSAIARLDHPGIVRVYRTDQCEHGPYVLMEAVAGVDLARLASRGDLTVANALEVVLQMARAIDHAHERGIIHRDLKPANVLVTSEGRIKIVDFGIARDLDAESVLTGSGALLGTPAYMSPEQFRDARKASSASDIYSLGAVLYELLTGFVPFEAPTLAGIIDATLRAPLVPPSRRRPHPEMSDDLDRLVATMLARRPDERYESARAVALDVERLLRGEPVRGRHDRRP